MTQGLQCFRKHFGGFELLASVDASSDESQDLAPPSAAFGSAAAKRNLLPPPSTIPAAPARDSAGGRPTPIVQGDTVQTALL